MGSLIGEGNETKEFDWKKDMINGTNGESVSFKQKFVLPSTFFSQNGEDVPLWSGAFLLVELFFFNLSLKRD